MTVEPELHRSLRVVIPGRPPNTNDANRQTAQQKWRVRREWRKTATQYVGAEIVEWQRRHGLSWRPLKVATVEAVFVLPDARRRDLDNLVSTLKPILDGAVDAGAVVDDSIGCLNELYVSFRIVKGSKGGTQITFSEPTA